MDVLLSLPIATYLLAPSLTSWSTSLNLLFFYMTWTTLVLSHSPLRVRLTGTLAVRLVLWLLPSLASLAFDEAVPSLAESLKYGGRSALPPRDGRRVVRTAVLGLFNVGVFTALEGGLSLVFTALLGEPEFRPSTTLPLPWQIGKHILLILVARETLHYYLHRFILHSNKGGYLAKKHKAYAHARSVAPYSLQLFADHPLALIVHRFIPLYLPALLLRPHLLTYLMLVALTTAEETLAVSGYSVVPGIIMGGIVQRAAIHYAGGGSSNFGAWGFLDWAHGTSKGRDVLDDVKAEAEKHHVKERANRKKQQGKNMLEKGVEAWREGNGTRRSTRKRTPRRAD